MKPPLSKEEKRLQDLMATGIMDTVPEQIYDDIAILAAYICKSPIAYISFIDGDRQWYKSRVNLSIKETTIDEALCATTIQETGLIHVSDLSKDKRFQNNPFVKSKDGIRFYAGYPLINSEGSALGTLCVIDYKVKELDEHQKNSLEALGRQVMALLDMRRALNTSRHHALHDNLTGLPNRLYFRERLNQACREAKRHNERCAVLFIDLDKFKLVNDTHGHHIGDLALKNTALKLRSVLREEDTVGRFGGDEFVVILNRIKDAKEAGKVASSIQEALERPLLLDGITVNIGASIGISLYPDHGLGTTTLINRADAALYEVKKSSRGSHQFFNSPL